jgi:uncharacterized protein (TIGR03000 family)
MQQRRLAAWAGGGALALLAGLVTGLTPPCAWAGGPGGRPHGVAYNGFPSVGIGIGIGGYAGGAAFAYPGFGFGYYPGGYRGFWSNGFSLYGPPVPTYGIVPGTFGGSDQRIYPLAPIWFPPPSFHAAPPGGPPLVVNPFGPPPPLPPVGPAETAPEPRPFLLKPEGDDIPPPPRPLVEPDMPVPTASRAPSLAPRPPQPIEFEVVVANPSAELRVDGWRTHETGPVRRFHSPPLAAGETYRYEFAATWQEDDRPRTVTRTVEVRPGEKVRVDLTESATVRNP